MRRTRIKLVSRTLRRSSTDAEERLWELLRHRQLMGCKFRRQHPIGRYVVDFACPSRRLAIELDGSSHHGKHTYDRKRTAYLVSRGFDVMRFWNDAIVREPDAVLAKISERLSGGYHR